MVLPTLSVYLLGGFQVFRGETALADSFKLRLQAFFAYLLLHRDMPVSRQQLAFHFWPDSTEAQARANVRKLVYRLRHTFPAVDDYLELEGTSLNWRSGIPLRLDVAQFEEALEGAKGAGPARKVSSLTKAAALYKGELLPDLYDDWVLAARERLRQRYLQALQELATLHEQQRAYAPAISLVRRMLREQPLMEEAYRQLMRLQALDGDVAGALRTYHRCAQQLEQELGIQPAQATQAVYDRLLNRRERLEPARARHTRQRFALVGREAAWQKLLAAWRLAAVGRPQVVIISGEAGIGKTRLAEELLNWTGRQGIAALRAACFSTEAPIPLRPVSEWLRSEAVGQALPALAPRWRSEVARVLPELLAADSELEAPQPMSEAWQQQTFFMALTEAITAAGEPLLLFLDDLHWADADTLSWLHFLAQQKGDHGFLLLGAVRAEDLVPDHRLLSWQQALSPLLPVHELALERLAAHETAALASAILGRSLEPEIAASLYEETEGNPLFTVEMVRAGFERAREALPDKVRSVIEIRLGKLSAAAQDVAALAAVIGRHFAFPLLQAASPWSEAELLDSVDELWQRQIIVERGDDDYDFSHDKIREGVLRRLTLARQRWWHRRVAAALEQLPAAELKGVHGQIAAHWEAAGELAQAAAAYQRAGEAAETLYANDEAVSAYRRALSLLESDTLAGARAQRTQLLGRLGRLLLRTGRKQEAEEALEKALRSMPPGSAEEARLQRLLGDSLSAQAYYEEALTAYGRAEAALPAKEQLSPGPELTHWIDIQFSRLNLYYWQGDARRIRMLMDDVGPFVERQGTPQQRVRYLHSSTQLGVRLARYAPPLDEALAYARRALQASREADLQWQACLMQFGIGFIRLWRGEEAPAEGELKAALQMAEAIGHEEVRLLALTYLGVLNRRRGALLATETFARQSLELARAGKWGQYIGAAEANLAWVAYSSGDDTNARRRGYLALDWWQDSAFPFQWLALWPLLAITMQAGEEGKALDLAQGLLAPTQQRLPAPLALALESALTLPGAHAHLEVALRLAREHRFL